jgi:hypothetical protein
MKKSLKIILFLFVSNFFISSCSKDKLKGTFNEFEGKYEWKYTQAKSPSTILADYANIYSTHTGFKLEIELNNKGEILFFKNGELFSKNAYRLKEKTKLPDSNSDKVITLKLKGNLNGMQFMYNEIKLTLKSDTALFIDAFPFPAIDDVEKYAPGYALGSNQFRKK